VKTINFLSASNAYKLGIDTIYFGYTGIGDQIMLLAAAEQYYRLTGNKILLACQYPDIFDGAAYCYILSDLDSVSVEKCYLDQCKSKRCYSSDNISLSGHEFTLKFIAPFDVKRSAHGEVVRKWPKNHGISRLCERLGLSGEIEISPKFHFDDIDIEHFYDEKIVYRQSKDYIVIMAGGRKKYKSFDPKLAQHLIDALSGHFDFVQVGAKGDPPLNGVRHLLGCLSLKEIALLLKNASLFVGTIGGLMHMARASLCPSVIAFSGEPLSYEYYNLNSYVYSDAKCDLCSESLLDPSFSVCPNEYICITSINPDSMLGAIEEKLSNVKQSNYAIQKEIISSDPAIGMKLWQKNKFYFLIRGNDAVNILKN
jgi:hypothetical protein